MRFILALVLIVVPPAVSAAAQPFVVQGPCVGGQCPPPAALRGPSGSGSIPPSAGSSPAELHIDDAAIVRVTNARAGSMSAGTGTLVDAEPSSGLVVTCAHLFREGTGEVSVVFPNRQTFAARVIKTDAGADLAALAIGAPTVAPIELAESFPRPGDPLVSCGYGSDGRLWCNRGQALGYVTAAGGENLETLELSGAARQGDSGGPVLDRDHHLVAVLFGTNGRVVDGTFCGRVRRFLAGLSPRFGRPRPPVATAPNAVAPVAPNPPAATAPPAVAPPAAGTGDAEKEKLARLDELVKRMTQAWQNLATKVDALVATARQAQQAADAASAAANANAAASPAAAGPSTDNGASAAPPPPITTNVPAPPATDPLETLAEPWLSAKLAAVLVSFGVPGGIAGVAAGAAVWLVMRRGKQRLQAELDRRGAAANGDATAAADPSVVQHHNQYVPYETTALDKAWAAAHAHVGEKYPGAVPYLKMVEGVKDQLLGGNNNPSLS